ncbi:glycosyltransferase [Bacillus sp. FJAT-42376]|uniref:glycosyltransferase family 4 protein n=1 Tax=Bacillus sp. FJAT-42376 TaxID=2014076 RepID=UPI000F50E0B9|nr:glycosyltransferase family 4 protein [Bacillus sp. FJAT-42376]AZB44865.1 glycosyltransferase [Bacillus sp. FJAT-42376]
MKVLFIYYVPSGGVETLNRQRAKVLTERGIECHFLYYRQERPLINDHGAPLYIQASDFDIMQTIQLQRFDAIVVTSDYTILPKIRSWGYTGKLIFEIQGLGSIDTARITLTAAVSYVTPYASCILSSKTPHIMRLIYELYPSFPIHFIDNCFDADQFTFVSGPRHGRPIIGWIGRIEDNKNWREFLHIAYHLTYIHQVDADYFMFEDHTLSIPAERAEFDILKGSLGIENRLTILSNIPNDAMAGYFSRMGDSGGFLCSTSKVEGFGYAIVEAMSCSCPVLSTNSDGVQRSIIHNQTGKFYSLGDIKGACMEAVELLNNSLLREQIITGAIHHIKERFSGEMYFHHFSSILNH